MPPLQRDTLETSMLETTHQSLHSLQGHVPYGLPQPAQGADGRAIAAGQVVPGDGQEVVLAALQVQHQDVLDLLEAQVEVRRRGAVNKHIQVDVHLGPWEGRRESREG